MPTATKERKTDDQLRVERERLDRELTARAADQLYEQRRQWAAERNALALRDDRPTAVALREATAHRKSLEAQLKDAAGAEEKALLADRQHCCRVSALIVAPTENLERSAPPEIQATIVDLHERIKKALAQESRRDVLDRKGQKIGVVSNAMEIAAFTNRCREAIAELIPLQREVHEPAKLAKLIASIAGFETPSFSAEQ